MNEEEFKECSVVAYPHEIRFLNIKGGRISYYVDRHISDYINKLQEENQRLKEQLEECQLQNLNLREDIMIKKMSFPNKEIKDKSFLELYDMPSYEDLKNENQQLKENYECILKQRDDITKNATEQLEASVGIVEHNRAIQEHIDKERELQNQLQQKEDIINKAKDIIKELAYGGNEDYYMEEFKKVLEILDNKGE